MTSSVGCTAVVPRLKADDDLVRVVLLILNLIAVIDDSTLYLICTLPYSTLLLGHEILQNVFFFFLNRMLSQLDAEKRPILSA